MEVITIQSDAFQAIIDKLNSIEKIVEVTTSKNPLEDHWLDISDVCRLLNISKRTLQSYRDNKVLPFSQVGGKIYFKAADIQKHLDNHYQNANELKK